MNHAPTPSAPEPAPTTAPSPAPAGVTATAPDPAPTAATRVAPDSGSGKGQRSIVVRYLSLVMLVVLAAASLTAALITRDTLQDQEDRLTAIRANEIAGLVTSSSTSLAGSLKLLGGVYLTRPDAPAAFTTLAKAFVQNDVRFVGVAQLQGGAFTVRAVSGTGPAANTNLDPARANVAQRALDQQNLASVLLPGSTDTTKLLFRAVGMAAQTVIFYEAAIDQARVAPSGDGSPLQELDAVVYASTTAAPAAVVLTTTGDASLSDVVDQRTVTVGADTWLMVTSPRHSLIGSFAQKVPWIILAVGLMTAVLASLVVEILLRRRTYAMNLIEVRTRELQQTQDDLIAARVAADQANRSKSEFLSRMSHELRTPLNAVLGFAQVLETDPLTEGQVEAAQHIVKGGKHLLNLINEILDISRIETGNLALSTEPVSLRDLVQEAVDLMGPLATNDGIEIIVDESAKAGAYVLADRQRLKQVLLNLLSNAVKYNRPHGTVTVSCSVQPHRPFLRLSVTDTGPGISDEQQELLFVPFERLGAEHTPVEGTGIGLALCDRLAQAMGGSLSVKSAIGRGSTFTVELPAAEGPVERFERMHPRAVPQPTRMNRAQPRAAAPWRLLSIEDNAANLRLIERVFANRTDVEVVAAIQGRLGLDLARNTQPAVVLLDLHLPDMPGWDVLAELREDPLTRDIPVVVVSADASHGQIQRLLQAGATAYLTKPLDVRRLAETVDSLLLDRVDA
jgi:signal transduction histidine kinase/ActR/RegA family two-component response regulator